MAEMTGITLDEAKQNAAERAVVDNLHDGVKVIGIGSGSTIVPAVVKIAELFKEGKLHPNVVFIPTGYQASNLILKHGLPMGSLEIFPTVEVAIDGADEVDPSLNCIKGGGGCHFQEKLVAYNSNKFILIADWRKESQKLGTQWLKGVPVSVYPPALQPVIKEIKKLGEPVLRKAKNKAGPVVTDDGALILDVHFKDIAADEVQELDQKLHMIPGVVETGFFSNAELAYIGLENGTVKVLTRAGNDAPAGMCKEHHQSVEQTRNGHFAGKVLRLEKQAPDSWDTPYLSRNNEERNAESKVRILTTLPSMD